MNVACGTKVRVANVGLSFGAVNIGAVIVGHVRSTSQIGAARSMRMCHVRCTVVSLMLSGLSFLYIYSTDRSGGEAVRG